MHRGLTRRYGIVCVQSLYIVVEEEIAAAVEEQDVIAEKEVPVEVKEEDPV